MKKFSGKADFGKQGDIFMFTKGLGFICETEDPRWNVLGEKLPSK